MEGWVDGRMDCTSTSMYCIVSIGMLTLSDVDHISLEGSFFVNGLLVCFFFGRLGFGFGVLRSDICSLVSVFYRVS